MHRLRLRGGVVLHLEHRASRLLWPGRLRRFLLQKAGLRPTAPAPLCPSVRQVQMPQLVLLLQSGWLKTAQLTLPCFCRARSSHSGPPDPGWALSVPCALGYMFLSARTRGHRGHSIACKVGLHAVAACGPCLAFSGQAGSGPCLTATVCL